MAKKKPPAEPPAPTTKPQVIVLPAQCPRCRSTAAAVIKRVITRQIAGELGGHAYTQITWRDMLCRNCGQRYRARHYEHPGATPAK